MNKYEEIAVSDKDYETKIQLLEREKERIIKAYNSIPYIDRVIKNLEDGAYLEVMLKEKGKIHKQLVGSGIFSLASIIPYSYSVYDSFQKELSIGNVIFNPYSIFVILTFAGQVIIGKEYRNYKNSIESYQRRLK